MSLSVPSISKKQNALNHQPPVAAYPWIPSRPDGTYLNPVIFADYSDPDVIRVGEDFYMTASSFNCTPGLPILHSKDLVNWTIINHAIKNLPHPRYGEVQHGCGVWAPAIRFHAGKYWIYFPMPDEGIYVVTASHPAGKWSEPHLVEAGRGLIDPCPLWDDDGHAYLVHAYAKSRSGIKHMLRVRPMDADGLKLLGEGRIVFHDSARHPTLEGPKFMKRDGWYYILAPAGGVKEGWQTVLRSRHVYGPYEDRIILEQGKTSINGPHQGALVDDVDGNWWFVHFQDAGIYGRVIHLQPAAWKDGWPTMGMDYDHNGIGEPVTQWKRPVSRHNGAITVPQTSDNFSASTLGLQWQWHGNHCDSWASLSDRQNWLRLRTLAVPDGDLSKAPNLLLQKFPAQSFTVETELEQLPAKLGDEAGLVIMGRTYATLAMRWNGSKHQIIFRHDQRTEVLTETTLLKARLRVHVSATGQCEFSYSIADGFQQCPFKFHAREGEWIGAKIGLYSMTPAGSDSTGFADFKYFRFE